jgi:hypothetical protein
VRGQSRAGTGQVFPDGWQSGNANGEPVPDFVSCPRFCVPDFARIGIPAGPEREIRAGNREEVRAGSHAVSPIQRQPAENAVAFRSVAETPSLPGIHLRPRIEAARSDDERPAGNEAGQREVSVRPID